MLPPPLLSLLRKKVQAVSPSYTQSKAQTAGPSSENFVTIGGCFERYTYCVTALGWLKKEDELNSDF